MNKASFRLKAWEFFSIWKETPSQEEEMIAGVNMEEEKRILETLKWREFMSGDSETSLFEYDTGKEALKYIMA